MAERSLSSLAWGIQRCRRCERWKSRTHAVAGNENARARIVLLGEAPGKNEDKTGKPFVGRAGHYLDKILNEFGFSRQDFFITSILKCYADTTVRKDQMAACRPWSQKQFETLDPKLIVIMGRSALSGFLHIDRRIDSLGETVWQNIPCIISSHPAAAMRFPDQDRQFRRAFSLLKEKSDNLGG